jgi:predicted nuclease of predicted toxin-antitoxin system
MRLLLDESVPARLRHHLPAHQVSTVREMGWAGSTNGILLARAARYFDVLITTDKNMQYQQNLSSLPITVVILAARSNATAALVPLMPRLEAALSGLPSRSLVVIGPALSGG